MGVRTGFNRMARVAATLYWIFAGTLAVILSIAVLSEQSAAARRAKIPFSQSEYLAVTAGDWQQYDLRVADGRSIHLTAPDKQSAQRKAKEWAVANPTPNAAASALMVLASCLTGAAMIFGAGWGAYRLARWVALGFAEKPPQQA